MNIDQEKRVSNRLENISNSFNINSIIFFGGFAVVYKMKRMILGVTVILLMTVLITSCGTDRLNSGRTPEKIEFPTVECTISPLIDTTIFGSQGTRIFISSGTFQFKDGRLVTDSIKINLKEFYNKTDIILANLSTVSDDKLLETGGMIFIDASSNGQKIEIKNDKRIVVHFPKEQSEYKSMNLFYADETATDSTVQNWIVDTVDLVKTTVGLGAYGYTWGDDDDDPTGFEYIPKNYVDTGYYYWSPLDLYVNQYDFSKQSIDEINNFNSSVDINFILNKKGKVTNPIIESRLSKSTKRELIKFMNSLPELEPYKNKHGIISNLEGHISLNGGNIIPIYKLDAKYISSFNNKYSKYENAPIKNMNDAELNYYIFSVSKLGWINCDRFIDNEETVDFLVQTLVDPKIKLKMVFKDINGVLIADVINGKYTFPKVPVGQKVTVIGIKNDGSKFSTAFKEITISKTPLDELVFTETSLADLRKKLEKI